MHSASLRFCKWHLSQPSGGGKRSGSQNELHPELLCAGERGRNDIGEECRGDRGRGDPGRWGGARRESARSPKPPRAGHQRAPSPRLTSLGREAGSRWGLAGRLLTRAAHVRRGLGCDPTLGRTGVTKWRRLHGSPNCLAFDMLLPPPRPQMGLEGARALLLWKGPARASTRRGEEGTRGEVSRRGFFLGRLGFPGKRGRVHERVRPDQTCSLLLDVSLLAKEQ